MTSETALQNFSELLSNFCWVKAMPDCPVAIVYDTSHATLANAIQGYLKSQTVNFKPTFYLVENCEAMDAQLQQITSNEVILLLHDNSTLAATTPVGNPVFFPLVQYIEDDTRKFKPGKYFPIYDIADIFDEFYHCSPQYLQDLDNRVIARFTESKLLQFNDSKQEFDGLAVKTQDLENEWCQADNKGDSFLPGEVANYSGKLSGKINFYGLIISRLPFTQKYGLISDPLTLEITNSKVVNFTCSNAQLAKDLDYYFSRSEYNNEVCEIGVGTNLGLKKLKPVNAFCQERFAGFHLGFGGKSDDSIHLDMIFADPIIKCDNDILFENRDFHFLDANLASK